jgi:hypothetical protein
MSRMTMMVVVQGAVVVGVSTALYGLEPPLWVGGVCVMIHCAQLILLAEWAALSDRGFTERGMAALLVYTFACSVDCTIYKMCGLGDYDLPGKLLQGALSLAATVVVVRVVYIRYSLMRFYYAPPKSEPFRFRLRGILMVVSLWAGALAILQGTKSEWAGVVMTPIPILMLPWACLGRNRPFVPIILALAAWCCIAPAAAYLCTPWQEITGKEVAAQQWLLAAWLVGGVAHLLFTAATLLVARSEGYRLVRWL